MAAVNTSQVLSTRVRPTVEQVLPGVTAALAARDKTNGINGANGKNSQTAGIIDLATAENYLIREELIAISKEIIRIELTNEALSYPKGFGGDPELLRALASFFNSYFSPHVKAQAEHVVAGPGATGVLVPLLCSLCDQGDAVIIPGAYWNGFDIHFKLLPGVEIINIDNDGNDRGLGPDDYDLLRCLRESLAAASLAKKKVKMVVITNPGNPVGRCYSQHDLEDAARFCQENDLHLISDEVYALSKLRPCLDGGSSPFVSALSLDLEKIKVDPARVHVVWGTSKDFGSSGFRLGCVVSRVNIALKASIGLMTTTQISSLTALVTTGLLNHPDLSGLIEMNRKRLQKAYKTTSFWLRRHQIDICEEGTAGIYVLARLCPNARTWTQESELCARLKAAGVLVAPGRQFHFRESHKGWFRIIIAVEEGVLLEALRRMEIVLGLNTGD
ncbi:pyridoxal phosphate-dependent transferase [Podospora australis]|uniref:Pyridoxal phosphate-dependent transferase n=1 Tax=Podospora australis TaxID=1536484 RepID=A0AAN6WHR1_9PEZI|nr:pyridoxal phosphate-dependent transferase [Podospora australis]